MDLTLTDGQRAISRTAAEVLADCAATSGRRTAEGSDEWSRALWKQLADLGWTALSVPESYGGAGAGFLEACLVIEQLAAARVPSPYLLTVCAAEALRRFGTEQQLAAWLPEIAEGRPVGYVRAAADSVRGTGNSTIDAIDHGSGILLSGTAEFVPFAEAVDTFIVVAGRPSGLTTFLVGPVRTGLDRSRMDVVGPDPYYRVRFDRVPVAGDTVLGRWDRGQEVLAVFEAFGAGAVCAEMIGGAQRVLDLTLDHARNRRQFARPIGSFQAVQHRCADMAVDVLGARLLGYEAIWRLGTAGAESAETALTVSAAKAWTGDAYRRVCDLGQQIHGAIGFTAEHELHLYLKHALSAAQAFGTPEAHADRIADGIGLPRLRPQ